MCWQKEIGGPSRPNDAHDAGSWGGAAGTSKCAIEYKHQKMPKYALWAVFVAANTCVGSTCAA